MERGGVFVRYRDGYVGNKGVRVRFPGSFQGQGSRELSLAGSHEHKTYEDVGCQGHEY